MQSIVLTYSDEIHISLYLVFLKRNRLMYEAKNGQRGSNLHELILQVICSGTEIRITVSQPELSAL